MPGMHTNEKWALIIITVLFGMVQEESNKLTGTVLANKGRSLHTGRHRAALTVIWSLFTCPVSFLFVALVLFPLTSEGNLRLSIWMFYFPYQPNHFFGF